MPDAKQLPEKRPPERPTAPAVPTTQVTAVPLEPPKDARERPNGRLRTDR